MSKIILVVVLTGLLAATYFVLRGSGGKCLAYNQAQCEAKLVCKPFYEYGIHCTEDGCQEGEKFKECTPRF
ncbi:MAG: hypothetical protein UX88_C0002G0021 [Candidatus Woesebacteria bacterium GW2011_GWC2_47_16]|uniref:Uncharacterized protein n=9 Tax=Candidatus Woeseibacteriota TaxID=1752722 RepID=A0A0G1TQJ8_9BACT|nr:MAG: hypothetical protein UX03_C0001G0021 [Candidatus Woesebacteria bacterium GW2011_GWE1_45_18]KKU25099.1 MAG: hypothetical protein UX34_C0003G0024 [Candidatus Woesebacteria bacterium GW2011_GWF1_46_13]KKU47640.1 MAG: hypothetical protein UX67_C0032G0004 [Candidatus Woesebacteria bacterium GW2011_GWF2_46_8]KKU65320.1 MAG: hypothetical protein UX88_C0002G0021 [Candidatus Woesebacteria bacterium GW2011_GWC2_47_16]KKU71261.1 MAG: hypothetical protein UX95_C0001G0024 [Candidatus Woesebacteria b